MTTLAVLAWRPMAFHPSSPVSKLSSLAMVGICGASLSGCFGCGSKDLEDATGGEPFQVSAQFSFKSKQTLAGKQILKIKVRNNEASRVIPNIAVTLKGLDRMIPEGDNGGGTISDRRRPIWIINQGPKGGESAYADTWSLGSLPAGADKVFEWNLTPVYKGRHKVTWQVAGDLDRKGTVVPAEGGVANGEATIKVAG